MVPNSGRSAADREVRVTHIASTSFAALISLGCSVCGLIAGMIEAYTVLKADAASGRLPDVTPVFVIKDMCLTGAVRFVAWLVIGFVAGGVFAGFFNLLARTTGGLRIRVRDADNA